MRTEWMSQEIKAVLFLYYPALCPFSSFNTFRCLGTSQGDLRKAGSRRTV
uniref:Uncharacterized protein n=1 Tax=Kalanchoe fedtschenkoi TaxID=63787 RepID=A0A7N0U4V6_KALFE